MDNYDLKIIKKKYGEKMSHLCRDLFPSLLETKGLLSKLMLDNFEPTRFLYDDLLECGKINDFKNYLYKKYYNIENCNNDKSVENPINLMKKAGYILKECHNEKQIQSYKKYYAHGEELCTFKGGRLDRCRVFFAVKENVNDIKRNSFKNPQRQDEYGTSVISIQFSKDNGNYLSIKNRYNHSVRNPDATFSNDLDNIILGLTDSFDKHYGLKQKVKQGEFELPDYIIDETGKYHRYNYEIDNIYYCPNNSIIENGVVKRLEYEKYILMDYFILDLVNKIIMTHNDSNDSFFNDINNINKIVVKKMEDEKEITILCNNGTPIIIRLDKYNRIVEYSNENISEIPNYFLRYNKVLRKINVPNIKRIQDHLFFDKELTEFKIPNGVQKIGEYAFAQNKLTSVEIPDSVNEIGEKAFYKNRLKEIKIPNGVKSINRATFSENILQRVELPDNLEEINDNAFYSNNLSSISIPNSVDFIGDYAFANNQLVSLTIPENVKIIEDNAFSNNCLIKLTLNDNIGSIGDYAFADNFLTSVTLPNNLWQICDGCFSYNLLKDIKIPESTVYIGEYAFYRNKIKMVVIPEYIRTIGKYSFDKHVFIFDKRDLKYKYTKLFKNVEKIKDNIQSKRLVKK